MTHSKFTALRKWSIIILVLVAVFSSSCEHDSVQPNNSPERSYQGDLIPDDPGDESNEAGGFTLRCINTSVRSYTGGGGVFVVTIQPDPQFNGSVRLEVEANPLLGAKLTRYRLDEFLSYAELTVEPAAPIAPATYDIVLRATHHGKTISRILQVDIHFWSHHEPGMEILKRDEFVSWLSNEHPELGDFAAEEFRRYMTYPEILVVEHWTFLSDMWEFRLCYHVMIPPHDWSKMLLRRRGCSQPLLAAQRESDGTIAEMPVDEYPVFLGSAHH